MTAYMLLYIVIRPQVISVHTGLSAPAAGPCGRSSEEQQEFEALVVRCTSAWHLLQGQFRPEPRPVCQIIAEKLLAPISASAG